MTNLEDKSQGKKFLNRFRNYVKKDLAQTYLAGLAGLKKELGFKVPCFCGVRIDNTQTDDFDYSGRDDWDDEGGHRR